MKKNDRKKDKQPSFNDEAFVLDSFERFFIFEFYIRYLKSHQGQDLTKILELKELIRNKFIELDIIFELSKYELVFDDDPESTYKSDIDLYELVNWTLNSIQSCDISLSTLCSEFSCSQVPKSLIRLLFNPFEEFNNTIDPSIKMLCYKFSDLTNQNNIKCVFNWWKQNLSQDFRTEKNLIGRVGLTSKQTYKSEENGLSKNIKCWTSPPFLSPNLIVLKKYDIYDDIYHIYNSEDYNVSVESKPFPKSIVLNVKFDNQSKNIDRILEEFKFRFESAQQRWFYDYINSETGPKEIIIETTSTEDSALKNSNCLILRYDSISKNLIGLMCYDLYLQGKEKNVSLEETAVIIANETKDIEVETIVKYYYSVKNKINDINKTIEKLE